MSIIKNVFPFLFVATIAQFSRSIFFSLPPSLAPATKFGYKSGGGERESSIHSPASKFLKVSVVSLYCGYLGEMVMGPDIFSRL